MARWQWGKEPVCQCRRHKRHRFHPCGDGTIPGDGNSYPLQYSCLENPMDRGAWWATVHGVKKSRIGLKRLTDTWRRRQKSGNARPTPILSWHSQSPASKLMQTDRELLITEQLLGPGTPNWLLNSVSDTREVN